MKIEIAEITMKDAQKEVLSIPRIREADNGGDLTDGNPWVTQKCGGRWLLIPPTPAP